MSFLNRLLSTLKVKITEIAQKENVPSSIINAIKEEATRIIQLEIASYEAETSELRRLIGVIEAEKSKILAEDETLKSIQKHLTEENAELKERIASLEEKRPRYSPSELMLSLKEAMESMQEGLESTEESRVNYVLRDFTIDLKARVGLSKNHKIIIQTPELSEKVPTQNLSMLHIALQTTPKLRTERRPVTVPNLIGMMKERAIKAIEEAGLKMQSVTEKVSRIPVGVVIGQDPEPYGKASLGFPVTLIIAKKPEVEVPNLVGMNRENVEKILTDSGLKLGKVTEKSVKAKPGVVLSQSIKAGAEVKEGSIVDLTVSKLAIVKVPNLIKKDRETAMRELKEAGLKVNMTIRSLPRAKKNTVVEQDPLPGTEVPAGTAVKIVVPRG